MGRSSGLSGAKDYFHLVIRVWVDGTLTNKDLLEVPLARLPEVLKDFVENHVPELTRITGNGAVFMIEIENLDLPIEQRFLRWGTDPAGMVMPMRLRDT